MLKQILKIWIKLKTGRYRKIIHKKVYIYLYPFL